MSNLNEKVARFIAQFRSEAINSSREFYDSFVSKMAGRLAFGAETALARKMLAKLDIAYAEKTEDDFYCELLSQNIVQQICNIYGVEKITITRTDNDCELTVRMHIYYPHKGKIYDFGVCRFKVSTETVASDIINNGYPLSLDYFKSIVLEDGVLLPSCPCFFECVFTRKDKNTIYGSNFCFGHRDDDIAKYLLAGDFVSAIQIASLCLHYVSVDDADNIPCIYNEVYAADRSIDIRAMAEYFDLSQDEAAEIEARQRELEERKQKRNNTSKGGEENE